MDLPQLGAAMTFATVLLLAGSALAYPPLLSSRENGFSGVATFNNYASQGSTTCGKLAGTLPSPLLLGERRLPVALPFSTFNADSRTGSNGAYGAAASDISPDISGGKCAGNINPSQCSGQSPGPGFQAPQCPKTNCGQCYKVINQGGVGGGSVGGVGNSITVQIIDSCPSSSAQNFCKTDVPANQRCGDPNTNQLDIDQSAYVALTGLMFGGGPTLKIGITPTCCPGASGCDLSSTSDTDTEGGTGTQSSDQGASSTAADAAAATTTAAYIVPVGTIPHTGNYQASRNSSSTGTQQTSRKCKRGKKSKKRRAKHAQHKET